MLKLLSFHPEKKKTITQTFPIFFSRENVYLNQQYMFLQMYKQSNRGEVTLTSVRIV